MSLKFDLKIISGGQTGVDRAALDFAIRHGFPHGGWCPAGRRAEDGVLATVYDLVETPSRSYQQRTRWNVRDADATLLVSIREALGGGTALTARVAEADGKPWLHLSRESSPDSKEAGRRLRDFLREHGVGVLNVAGPRASGEPAAGVYADAVLSAALLE